MPSSTAILPAAVSYTHLVLGYSGSEVAAALKGIDIDTLPLEEIIRQALKRMVK